MTPSITQWITNQTVQALTRVFANGVITGVSNTLVWAVSAGGVAFIFIGIAFLLFGRTASRIAAFVFIVIGIIAMLPLLLLYLSPH